VTAAAPRRPWWRRKRTRAAVAVWLALPGLYILSAGPACYAARRGWTTEGRVNAAYHLVFLLADAEEHRLGLGDAGPLFGYLRGWVRLGERHSARD